MEGEGSASSSAGAGSAMSAARRSLPRTVCSKSALLVTLPASPSRHLIFFLPSVIGCDIRFTSAIAISCILVVASHCLADRLLPYPHTPAWPLSAPPEASKGSPDSRRYHDNKQPLQQPDVCEHPPATLPPHDTFPQDAPCLKPNPSAPSTRSLRMRLLSS